MTQAYSDPRRANDAHALPDVEVFYLETGEMENPYWGGAAGEDPDEQYLASGWYWWTCMPGCLPDSEPNGPYDSEELALADAIIDSSSEGSADA